MDDVTIARVIHVLAVLHWIGGLWLVTLVLLPAVGRMAGPTRRLEVFEAIEGRFSGQARVSVVLAGLSGFWMTWRLDAWWRFAEPGYWWMHAMVVLWAIFAVILLIAEPLVLHAWFHRAAASRPEAVYRLVLRAHRVLAAAAAVTVAGAVAGAHGMLF
ncbi:hypothetical protein [Tistrella mobilis]|uniref:hypothetical protein n=1 Tax=Tistrella mobilis TaxID=171437 RepID=UPI0035562C57